MFCKSCSSDLKNNHLLEDDTIAPMSNRSRIIHPKCSLCGKGIELLDVSQNIQRNKKVLLITGTAGAGKTALGQRIEGLANYVFVDGDAIQKRENHFAKRDPGYIVEYQQQTLNTTLIVLGLGYDVVVGYIINQEIFGRYQTELAQYGIVPNLRVLLPERSVCLERDLHRACWTAGEKWVDQWYEEMRSFRKTHPASCIDTSNETLDETFQRHFVKLL